MTDIVELPFISNGHETKEFLISWARIFFSRVQVHLK